MNIQKFFAKNSREVLQQVKRALGGDAVILSNRPVSGGVEMLAVAHREAQALVTEDRRAGESVHMRNAVGSADRKPLHEGGRVPTPHSESKRTRIRSLPGVPAPKPTQW